MSKAESQIERARERERDACGEGEERREGKGFGPMARGGPICFPAETENEDVSLWHSRGTILDEHGTKERERGLARHGTARDRSKRVQHTQY